MTANERAKAAQAAGYREKYAMQHGRARRKQQNGETLYIFTYSKTDVYQDANGATWSATRKAWIN